MSVLNEMAKEFPWSGIRYVIKMLDQLRPGSMCEKIVYRTEKLILTLRTNNSGSLEIYFNSKSFIIITFFGDKIHNKWVESHIYKSPSIPLYDMQITKIIKEEELSASIIGREVKDILWPDQLR